MVRADAYSIVASRLLGSSLLSLKACPSESNFVSSFGPQHFVLVSAILKLILAPKSRTWQPIVRSQFWPQVFVGLY